MKVKKKLTWKSNNVIKKKQVRSQNAKSSLNKILLGQIFALDVSWSIGPFRNNDHQWKKNVVLFV